MHETKATTTRARHGVSLAITVLLASFAPCSAQAVSLWTNLGGGDHQGYPWSISTPTTVGGSHTNVGTFTVDALVTVSGIADGGTGVFQVYATTVNVNATIDASGKGNLGKSGGAGGGCLGAGCGGASPTGGSAGDAGSWAGTAWGGGGGGGGGGLGGYGGSGAWGGGTWASGSCGMWGGFGGGGGTPAGNANDRSYTLGNGGGGGGGAGNGVNSSGAAGVGGSGGAGGGVVHIQSGGTFSFGVNGKILANGLAGGTGGASANCVNYQCPVWSIPGGGGAGGGGGSGGTIWLDASSYTNAASRPLEAKGGNGGTGGAVGHCGHGAMGGGGGGSGSGGRIKAFYFTAAPPVIMIASYGAAGVRGAGSTGFVPQCDVAGACATPLAANGYTGGTGSMSSISTNLPPNTPTNVSPAGASLVATSFPLLTGSTYADPDNVPLGYAYFELRTAASGGYYDTSLWFSSTSISGIPTVAVPDGQYFWRVLYVDQYGAQSAFSAETSFTVDTTPPTGPTSMSATWGASALQFSWATGADATSGLATTGKTYEVEYNKDNETSGGSLVWRSAVTTVLTTTASWAPAGTGLYKFRLKTYDAVGKFLTSATTTTVDWKPPTTPGAPQAANADTCVSNSLSVSWTASTDETSAVTYIVSVPGMSGFPQTTTGTTMVLNTSTWAAGTWNVGVQARDAAGNLSGVPATLAVLIDHTAPAAVATPSVLPGLTRVAFTVSWTAPSDGTNTTPLMYSVGRSADGGVTWQALGTTSTTTFSDVPAATGAYLYRVAPIDCADNTRAPTVSASVNFDKDPPNAPQDLYATQTGTGGVVTVSWSTTDVGAAGIASQELEYSIGDATHWQPLAASSPYTAKFSPNTYWFRARATDLLGNVGAWATTSFTLYVPYNTLPADDAYLVSTNPNNGVCTGTAPNGAVPARTQFQLTPDWPQAAVDSGSLALATCWPLPSTLLPGHWVARSRHDLDGNNHWTDWSAGTSFYLDVSPTNVAPSNGTTVTTTGTVTLTASDDPPLVTSSCSEFQVRAQSGVYSDTGPLRVEPCPRVNSWTTPSLAEGTWFFRVRYKDTAGSWTAWSQETSFRTDYTPRNMSPPDNATTAAPVVLSGSAPPPGTLISVARFEARPSDATNYLDPRVVRSWNLQVSPGSLTDTSWSPAGGLPGGRWFFRYQLEDVNGVATAWSTETSFFVGYTPSLATPIDNGYLVSTSGPNQVCTSGVPNGAVPAQTQFRMTPDWPQAVVESNTIVASTCWTMPATLLPGHWVARSRHDLDGNNHWTDWSAGTSFYLDVSPTNVAPSNGTTVTTTGTVTLTASDDPPLATSSCAEFQLRAQNGVYADTGPMRVEPCPRVNSWTTPSLAEGTWFFRVRYKDTAGSWTAWSQETSFRTDYTPRNMSPPDNATTAAPVVLSGSAPPPGTLISVARFEARPSDATNYLDPRVVKSWNVQVSPGALTDTSWGPKGGLSGGRWYFRYQLEDDNGVATSWSTETSFVVGYTPSIASPIDNGYLVSTNGPNQVCTSGAANGAVAPRTQFSLTDPTGLVTDSFALTTACATLPATPPGRWLVRARDDLDGSGNWTGWSASTSFYLDAPPSNVAPVPGAVLSSSSTVSLQGSAAPQGGVPAFAEFQLRTGSGSYTDASSHSSLLIASATSWTAPGLAEGIWYFRGHYADSASHWTAWSAETSFSVGNPVGAVAAPVAVSPRAARLLPGANVQLTAAVDGTVDQRVIWSIDAVATGAFVSATGRFSGFVTGTYTVRATSVANPFLSGAAQVEVTYNVLPVFPQLAPPPAGELPKVAGDFAALYTGTSPLQVGVEPGTISDDLAAVLHGAVKDSAGSAITGALVQVAGHAEYGSTRTRADGAYDLVVNGGVRLSVQVDAAGYVSAQRSTLVSSHGWNALDDIVLLQASVASSAGLNMSGTATGTQVARAATVSDSSGNRTATLIFPPGVRATAVLSDGTEQILSTSEVLRMVEYTQGEQGPAAMPAELPPGTEYTYAMRFAFDSSEELGATTVRFDQVVASYVDNFLGMPVGLVVPAGTYDEKAQRWVAGLDGVVLDYLGVDGFGQASLDLNGDGLAESYATLVSAGIDAAERSALAGVYSSTHTSLWRVPTAHFSAVDYNYSGTPPPPAPKKKPDVGGKGQCRRTGSIIECESQIIGEKIPVEGTPFELTYWTDRTDGYIPSLRIPLGDGDPAKTPESASYRVSYEGKVLSKNIAAPSDNLVELLNLPMQDAFGRPIDASRRALVKTEASYFTDYIAPTATPGLPSTSFGGSAGTGTGTRSRVPERRSMTHSVLVPKFNAQRQLGLGGWQLSDHHFLDREGGVLWFGDGRRLVLEDEDATIEKLVGGGSLGVSGTSAVPAADVDFTAGGLVMGGDGSVYWTDDGNGHNQILVMGLDGLVRRLAGGGTTQGDGPALNLALSSFLGALVQASNGDFYFVDDTMIRRLHAGRIDTVAGLGTGNAQQAPSGVALDASLAPLDIAVAPDGRLLVATGKYLASVQNGQITTLATFGGQVDSVTVTRQGTIYVTAPAAGEAGPMTYGLWRVDSGGTIRLVARLAAFNSNYFDLAMDTAEGPGDSVYVADAPGSCIRLVGPGGDMRTVAGVCDTQPSTALDLQLLHGSARAAGFTALVIAPTGDGGLLAANGTYLYRVTLPGTVSSNGLIGLPDEGGRLVHYFDGQGKHIKTVDGIVGAQVAAFAYDAQGRVSEITDRDGKKVTISRSGTSIEITARYGQKTTLTLNADGRVASVDLPESRSYGMTYDSSGLIKTFTDPRNTMTTLAYSAEGRLVSHVGPTNATQTLERKLADENAQGYSVTYTSGEGHQTVYTVETDTAGETRSVKDPAGRTTKSLSEGKTTYVVTRPDGTMETTTLAPDPRFGMAAPFAAKRNITTLGGRSRTITEARSLSYSPANPAQLTNLTSTVVDGTDPATLTTSTTTYDGASKTWTIVTPEGRTETVTLDANGRVAERKLPGADYPVNYYYNQSGPHVGRLSTVSQGGRSTDFTYRDDSGLLGTITHAVTPYVAETSSLSWTPAQRRLDLTYPDANVASFGFDAGGNMIGLTPPGKQVHEVGYDDRNLETLYRAPTITGATTPHRETSRTWNRDRQLDTVTLPSGQTVTSQYDPTSGEFWKLLFDRGTIVVARDPTTGAVTSVTAPGDIKTTFASDGPLPLGSTWSVGATPIGSVSYDYDEHWRRSYVKVEGSTAGSAPAPIANAYDSDGLLTQVEGTLDLTRNATSGAVDVAAVFGKATKFHRDSMYGEIDHIWTDTSRQDPYLDLSYSERDALGRIKTVVEDPTTPMPTTSHYAYDNRGRLSSFSTQHGGNGPTETYTWGYDANGNRTTTTGGVSPGTATYDEQDRLTYMPGVGSFAYDQLGRLDKKTAANGVTDYDYDTLGNLVRVQLPTGTVIDYEIDALGRRIGKKRNGAVETRWLWDGQLRPVAEVDAAGNVTSRFVYGEGVNVPEYMVRGNHTYAFVKDHLGSVRVVYDAGNGDILQSVKYDPWGNRTLVAGADDFQPFGFAGGLYDSDTGLVRFGARDYDPKVGRWTAKDLKTFKGGINLLGYCGSDPVNRVDPTGYWAFGIGVDFSAIAPVFSGGGVDFGVNVEWTSDAGWGVYLFSTPADPQMSSWGFIVGPAVQLNVATGTGGWDGPFDQAEGSFGPVCAGYFQSTPTPGGDAGYFGLSLGAGKGPPGLGGTTTNYIQWL